MVRAGKHAFLHRLRYVAASDRSRSGRQLQAGDPDDKAFADANAGLDVAFDYYNVNGDLAATQNSGGPGVAEVLQGDVDGSSLHRFIVVKNVGNTSGQYKLEIVPVK